MVLQGNVLDPLGTVLHYVTQGSCLIDTHARHELAG